MHNAMLCQVTPHLRRGDGGPEAEDSADGQVDAAGEDAPGGGPAVA